MDNNFISWLTNELEKRDWSNSKLAREAGLVPSTVSMVISGQNRPGFEFCIGVARALSYPPENILQKAGLLPPKPETDPKADELLYLFQQLKIEDQERLLQTARAWVEGK